MNKPELISFSDPLMIDLNFDQKSFFKPEIEFQKGGIDALLGSGLIKEDSNPLIEIDGSVAVLTIEGPLRPGRDWYYSTGYGDIQDAIVELIDNTRIRTVIQKIDSPGGTVKQAFETHEMFQELAKEKTLIALISGSATSAAALMTFPAKQRFLASKTAQTGSIGVVSQHIDNRIWYQEYMGEVRTSVAKGDMKDAGTDVRGFDDKAKEVFESAVNKLYDTFANEAVLGLGLTRERIDSQQSRVFIGDEGIENGFADGFMSLDELIERSKMSQVFSTPERPAFSKNPMEVNSMDINKLEAEYPDVYKAAVDRGKALGLEESKEMHTEEGRKLGMSDERKRISEINAAAIPGQENLTKELIESGATADFAVKLLAAGKSDIPAKSGKDMKSQIEGELQDGLESDTPEDAKQPETDAKDPGKDFEAAVKDKVDGGMKRTDAIKEVANSNPELHQKYLNALNGGKNE
jgi:ClpP class serine protease